MEWKPIKNAPYYLVSDEGHVKSVERFVKTFNGEKECLKYIPETYPLKEKDIRGYKNVSIIQYDLDMRPIKRYMRQVHRLVLETFNPVCNMENLQVNHIDGNKSNNKLSNLEWVTPKENTVHAHKVLNHKRDQDGENNSMSKLTTNQVIEIIKRINGRKKERDSKIAKDYGVSRKTIENIRLNRTWKHIPRDIS